MILAKSNSSRLALLVASLGLLLAGCNIVGPIAYVVEGPATTPARYTLPQRKIVIFVDDRGSVIPRTRLRRLLADRATKQLLQIERLVPAAINPEAVVRVAQAESNDQLLSIAEIGHRVGAEIIIYVQPQRFTLYSTGLPKPSAELNVKVIDCNTGARLFPVGMGPAEHLLVATMAAKPGSHFENTDTIRALEESLADFAGLRLAQLFYEHEPNPLDAERSR